MKKIILILCWLLTIKPAFAKSLDVYQPQGTTLTTEEKEAIYQRYAVQKTSGKVSRVDGLPHYESVMRLYYKNSGANEALRLADEGAELQGRTKKVFFKSLAIGGGAGIIGGCVAAGFTDNVPYRGESEVLCVIAGSVVGVVVGSITGGTRALVENARENSRYRKAGEAFNQSLLQKLDLDVAPLPGGADAKVSLRF